MNDNSDPNALNEAGFNWTNLDIQLERMVIPARQRVLARGETPYVLLSYVDFGASSFEHYNSAAEYAEFIYAVYRHMQTKYGFIPNGLDVIVEPDQVTGWTPTAIGNVIVATAQKLAKEGFAVPEFVTPSVVVVGNGVRYINGINAVSGAMALVKELSYHCYGGQVEIPDIAARAVTLGKRTSMTECVTNGNTYDLLRNDLTAGRNSAWVQGLFGDVYGCGFGQITQLAGGVVSYCPNSRIIRQYTKYVRPGARRIDAVSGNAAFSPLAFVNTNGRYVVVVKAQTDQSFSVNGLPAGTYGIFYATDADYDVQLPDVAINSGEVVTARIPASGVITIYSK